MDADGLITADRGDSVEEATRRFARPVGGDEVKDGAGVEEACTSNSTV